MIGNIIVCLVRCISIWRLRWRRGIRNTVGIRLDQWSGPRPASHVRRPSNNRGRRRRILTRRRFRIHPKRRTSRGRIPQQRRIYNYLQSGCDRSTSFISFLDNRIHRVRYVVILKNEKLNQILFNSFYLFQIFFIGFLYLIFEFLI